MQAMSSLDCDKSLLNLVIYLVLTWLLPLSVKGCSLIPLSKLKKIVEWLLSNMINKEPIKI